MPFSDYRNNDLSKYRSSFVSYTCDDLIGKNQSANQDSFIDMGVVSGTVAIDLSYHTYFKVTVGDSITITGTHSRRPKNINEFYVEIVNFDSNDIYWDTWFTWSSGSTPSLTISGTYLLSFTETNTIVGETLTYTNCIGYLG